jgi:hypothetical protein
MVHGLPHIEHIHQLCIDCVTTKLKRSPLPLQVKRRAEGLLDLVHGDLCGPITLATPGGKQYFLLLVDDKSRYMWVKLLAAKSDTLAAFKKFQAKVEVETGRCLRVLRTDNGVSSPLLRLRSTASSMASRGRRRHRTHRNRIASLLTLLTPLKLSCHP